MPIGDFFDAIMAFFQPRVEPIKAEIIVVPVVDEAPPKPAPREDTYRPVPSFAFGVTDYKLGTWRTYAEARANERDLRLEIQHRDPDAHYYMEGPNVRMQLSQWGIRLVVVPDVGNTWTLVLYGASPWAGERFCDWLTHDGGPYGRREDGTRWIAWPAWTGRAPGRTCKKIPVS